MSHYFKCKKCDAQFPKWVGKCSQCFAWSSLVEIKTFQTHKIHQTRDQSLNEFSPALSLAKISNETQKPTYSSQINELDRVLGQGIVIGSFVLLGGDPGIGKSTLLLQALINLGSQNVKSLYISGEESLEQIKLRSQRIGIPKAKFPLILCERKMEKILEHLEKERPEILVIDSIQTVYQSQLGGTPGSEQQLKETTFILMSYAKQFQCAIFIIGHITKGGVIAGPKLIEHMVDTVIYFEGEKHNHYRMLRSFKNRFGPTDEIGFFEMTTQGLIPISSPSHLFVQNQNLAQSGTTMSCCLQGSRPILVEIQALVNHNSSSHLQRVVSGVENKRFMIILALLQKFAQLSIGNNDVFVGIAGGLKIDDPSADLAIALAIASNFLNKSIPSQTLILGELSFNGTVRPVPQLTLRIKEALNMNFKNIVIPKTEKAPQKITKANIIVVEKLQNTLEILV